MDWFIRTQDGITREVRITSWVQCRHELVEFGSVDDYLQVIRPEVVAQCQKELTHGALFWVGITEEYQHIT